MKNISAYLHSSKRFKRVIPMLFVILKTRVGKKRAITQAELFTVVNKKFPKVTIREVRAAIHEIRAKRLIKGIVAGNRGYYIERDKKEILKAIRRLSGYISSMQIIKQNLAADYNNL